MLKQKPCAKLENWAVVPSAASASYQELRTGNLLVGTVFGHPRIQEGTFIFTSPIVSLHADAGPETQVVETKNTAYRLGEASGEYKRWALDHAGDAAA